MVVPGSLIDWIQAGAVTGLLGATSVAVGRALWADAAEDEALSAAATQAVPAEGVRAA